MTTTRTAPAGMPAGYDAREQSLWTQIQGLQQLTGRLHDRITKLEALTARMLMQLRDVQGAVEFAQPAPADQVGGDPAAPADQVGGDPAAPADAPPPAAPSRKRKGGAA